MVWAYVLTKIFKNTKLNRFVILIVINMYHDNFVSTLFVIGTLSNLILSCL